MPSQNEAETHQKQVTLPHDGDASSPVGGKEKTPKEVGQVKRQGRYTREPQEWT